MEPAGRGERRLCLAQPVGQGRDDARPESSSVLSTGGASTAIASSAPLPQTPHEDVV